MQMIDDKLIYRWQDVPEELFTKTVLKNEHGLKPIDESNPDAFMKSYIHGKWRTYNLYHIDNCKQIRRRVTDITGFILDDKTIASAIYVINKSAKKSRDTKQINYYRGKHRVVQRAKRRSFEIYELKNMVIDKLMDENRMEIIGYHKQQSFDNHLLLLNIADFTFHTPISKEDSNIYKYLGEIGIISASIGRKVDIKFNQAVKLLEKYLED